ncbi:MAG: response regulator transcription factor [Spirochaetales bacterium]|nr:response regulator transcription factor [Spirochaetales bacterium]
MPYKILYADDEVRFHKLLKIFLADEDYEIHCFSRGDDLLDYLYDNKADLVLLDIMMPGLDGYETCRAIRQEYRLPIIMLTALDDEAHEIRGIDSGADDYLSKPFTADLLKARIRGVLRRVKREEISKTRLSGILFDDVESSFDAGEGPVSLSPKEFELLKYLVMNESQILTREQLLNHVWGFDYYGDPRTLDTHIKTLRARLGAKSDRIKTIRGKGYSYRGDNL